MNKKLSMSVANSHHTMLMSNNVCSVLVKEFPENHSAAHARETTLLAYEIHIKATGVHV